MGATLQYAKVVDREHLQAHGGLSPGTDNIVALSGLTGHHDLVQEVPTGTGDEPDLGPRYRVKARP